MEVETWVIVPRFPNYEVSSLGRVRRLITRTSARAGRILKASLHHRGYLHHGLTVDGATKTVRLNRLICEAFHGPAPSRQHDAAHGDGDRLNNREGNLYWATKLQNAADMTRHGTRRIGSRNTQAKLTERDALEIRARTRSAGAKACDLARQYGVSSGLIRHVVSGRNWKHVNP